MRKVEPGLGLTLEHSQGTGHLDSHPHLDEEPASPHMTSDWEFH